MKTQIDYYLTPVSPWAYLGHDRFSLLMQELRPVLQVRPADFGAVFAASGGLLLAKRASQRQAYRLVELKRFSDFLQVPLNLAPAHFPVSGDLASRLLIAAQTAEGPMAALRLCGDMGRAVWAADRNLADPEVLQALLREADLPSDLLVEAGREEAASAFAVCTQQAIEAGVFGAPSYVVDGEIFWGQDRIDFVARRLRAPSTDRGAWGARSLSR